MNIQTFETHTDSKILSRGRAYYKSECITSLEYDGEEWTAEVEGSDDYTVSVSLSDEGKIINTYCDCPYEWGDYCKHQVAVFYALKDKSQQILAEMKAGKPGKKESFKDILEALDKPTLIALIMEYAKTYKPIKSEIQFRYAQKADVAKSARQVIRSAINAVKHRGYVGYGDVDAATEGADSVLQMMEDKIMSGDIFTAVSLGIILAEEMMDLLDYCDDSNGYVGGVVSEAINKMSDAVLAMPGSHEDSKKIFDEILDHALAEIYDGWTDWRIDLLSALVPLCGDKDNRASLESCLADVDNNKSSEWSRDFELRQKQGIQLGIIRQFDGEAPARHYIEQNLDNVDFRKMAIEFSIEDENYDRAIALCVEGEDNNSRFPGIVKQLRELRYAAYEAAGKKPEQKALALDLLLDGDFDYFLKYKDLHSKEEWLPAFYDVLDKAEQNSARGAYVKILVYEKHKPRLLAYCKKFPYAIVDYHKILLPEYMIEAGLLFSAHIRKQAEAADNRSRYSEVCRLIEICDKACPGATDALCDEIIAKYAKRPAFMDEMRKIGKL